jgi:hypothetical protein
VQKITGTYGIDVTDAGGASVTAGPAVLDDADRRNMSVPLQPSLPPGRYVVQYKNVSDADGDAFAAGFAFYVGVEPTAEQRAEDALLEPSETSATQTFEAGNGRDTPTAGATSTPAMGVTPEVRPSADDDDDGNGLALGFIVAGVAAAVVLIAVAGLMYWRRQQ